MYYRSINVEIVLNIISIYFLVHSAMRTQIFSSPCLPDLVNLSNNRTNIFWNVPQNFTQPTLCFLFHMLQLFFIYFNNVFDLFMWIIVLSENHKKDEGFESIE